MSGHCDFCNVWHSGSCCHPGQAKLTELERQLKDKERAYEDLRTQVISAMHEDLRTQVISAMPLLATLTIQIRQRYYAEITTDLQDQICAAHDNLLKLLVSKSVKPIDWDAIAIEEQKLIDRNKENEHRGL